MKYLTKNWVSISIVFLLFLISGMTIFKYYQAKEIKTAVIEKIEEEEQFFEILPYKSGETHKQKEIDFVTYDPVAIANFVSSYKKGITREEKIKLAESIWPLDISDHLDDIYKVILYEEDDQVFIDGLIGIFTSANTINGPPGNSGTWSNKNFTETEYNHYKDLIHQLFVVDRFRLATISGIKGSFKTNDMLETIKIHKDLINPLEQELLSFGYIQSAALNGVSIEAERELLNEVATDEEIDGFISFQPALVAALSPNIEVKFSEEVQEVIENSPRPKYGKNDTMGEFAYVMWFRSKIMILSEDKIEDFVISELESINEEQKIMLIKKFPSLANIIE